MIKIPRTSSYKNSRLADDSACIAHKLDSLKLEGPTPRKHHSAPLPVCQAAMTAATGRVPAFSNRLQIIAPSDKTQGFHEPNSASLSDEKTEAGTPLKT